MHLWVLFTGLVVDGAESGDQGGTDDRALLHGHAPLFGVVLVLIEYLLGEVTLLKQLPEAENRCLIRDTIADQIEKCLPRHYLVNLGQELLPLSTLFGGCLLVSKIQELLARHHIRTGIDLCPYSREEGLGVPGSSMHQRKRLKIRTMSNTKAKYVSIWNKHINYATQNIYKYWDRDKRCKDSYMHRKKAKLDIGR